MPGLQQAFELVFYVLLVLVLPVDFAVAELQVVLEAELEGAGNGLDHQ